MFNLFNNEKDAQPHVVRQGDVILIETDVDLDSQDIHPVTQRGRAVLAHGEVTGHKHRVETDAQVFSNNEAFDEAKLHEFAVDGSLPDPANDKLYLRVVTPQALIHEEHGPIELDPTKTYEVRRQREWDEKEGHRIVAD